MFVCFAPKNNPKIAIAVAVQNAGFGATWAGPIARILLEKYLNDTLQAKSKDDLERISKANLMPSYLKRLQQEADSIRAIEWYKITRDSSYLKKYSWLEQKSLNPPGKNFPAPEKFELSAIWVEEKYFIKFIFRYKKA